MKETKEMQTKPTVISIRQFWDWCVKPSKEMDKVFELCGMPHCFEYLAVDLTEVNENDIRIYQYEEDLLSDADVNILYSVVRGTQSSFDDGCYCFTLTLTTIK